MAREERTRARTAADRWRGQQQLRPAGPGREEQGRRATGLPRHPRRRPRPRPEPLFRRRCAFAQIRRRVESRLELDLGRGEEEGGREGGRRKKKMTCGARESVIGERAFNAIYVFIYTCSWAQVVFIRIPCHFCEKRKIVMVCFERDE